MKRLKIMHISLTKTAPLTENKALNWMQRDKVAQRQLVIC